MNLIDSILLGILQGLTEFLPISSSGHLVLAQYFLGISEKGVLIEVVLHMGTLAAVLFYFWNDLQKLLKGLVEGDLDSRKYFYYLCIATIPIASVGFLLNDFIKSMFIPLVVIIMLIINSLVIFSTYFFLNRSTKQLSLLIIFIIGMVQVFALMPGISRSGITISIAIIMGVRNMDAAKFSFLLAIPGLFGAGILEFYNIELMEDVLIMNLVMVFLSSALIGYLVISWLLNIISKGKFYYFSLYCMSLAIISYILIN